MRQGREEVGRGSLGAAGQDHPLRGRYHAPEAQALDLAASLPAWQRLAQNGVVGGCPGPQPIGALQRPQTAARPGVERPTALAGEAARHLSREQGPYLSACAT